MIVLKKQYRLTFFKNYRAVLGDQPVATNGCRTADGGCRVPLPFTAGGNHAVSVKTTRHSMVLKTKKIIMHSNRDNSAVL